jgi:hypothetical protein
MICKIEKWSQIRRKIDLLRLSVHQKDLKQQKCGKMLRKSVITEEFRLKRM